MTRYLAQQKTLKLDWPTSLRSQRLPTEATAERVRERQHWAIHPYSSQGGNAESSAISFYLSTFAFLREREGKCLLCSGGDPMAKKDPYSVRGQPEGVSDPLSPARQNPLHAFCSG